MLGRDSSPFTPMALRDTLMITTRLEALKATRSSEALATLSSVRICLAIVASARPVCTTTRNMEFRATTHGRTRRSGERGRHSSLRCVHVARLHADQRIGWTYLRTQQDCDMGLDACERGACTGTNRVVRAWSARRPWHIRNRRSNTQR